MLYVLVAFVVLGVWLFCLLDVLTADEKQIRGLPKFAWFLVVLLGFEIGAVLWLVLGRPRSAPFRTLPGSAATGTGTITPAGSRDSMRRHPDQGETAAPVEAPRGPDDDPEFLRNLDRRIRGED